MTNITYEQIVEKWNTKTIQERYKLCHELHIPSKHAEKNWKEFPDKHIDKIMSALHQELDDVDVRQEEFVNHNEQTNSPTLYEILGVSKHASDEEIKTSFRKQILKFHADKNNIDDADEFSKLLIEAKDVLTNHEKRLQYDRQIS